MSNESFFLRFWLLVAGLIVFIASAVWSTSIVDRSCWPSLGMGSPAVCRALYLEPVPTPPKHGISRK